MSSKKSRASESNGETAGLSPVVYHTPFSITGPEVEHGGRTYRLITKKDCLSFRSFADSLDGFAIKYNSAHDAIAWNKKVPGEPMHIIKVFGILPNLLPETLYDMLQDDVYRRVWDNYRMDAFRIVKLDDNNDIGYYAGRSPVPGVANRDFVNQRAWINAGNGEYVIFNTSVPHRDVPLNYLKAKKISNDATVRGISKITGYLIRPWTDEKCEHGSCVTYITQCDPGGWIPNFLTNLVSTKLAPNTLRTFRQAAVHFVEWLPKQVNYVKDWSSDADPYDTPVEHKTIAFAKEKWGPNTGREKAHNGEEKKS